MALKYYVKSKAKNLPTKKAERMIEKAVGGDVLKQVKSKKKADIVVGRVGKNNTTIGGGWSDIPHSYKEASGGAKTRIKVRDYRGYGLNKTAYGRKVKRGIAQTTAHEFGHAMGLFHKKGRKNNLMSYSDWGTKLTPQQKRKVKRISGTK